MAHFIELHKSGSEDTPICLNVECIAYIEPFSDDNGTYIKISVEEFRGTNGNAILQSVHVIESYLTVKELIGC